MSGINLMTFTYRNVDVFRYENGDYLFSVYYKLNRSCFYKYVMQKRVFENGKPIEKSVLLSIVLYVYGLNDLCREIIYRITF